MADRNERNQRMQRSYRDDDYYGSRQAEQFQDDSFEQDQDQDRRYGRQQGDDNGRRGSGNFYYEEVVIIPRRSRARGGRSDYERGGNFGEEDRYETDNRYGASHYDTRGRGYQPFTSEDQGGRDFVSGGNRGSYGYGARHDYGTRGYDRRDERGFFEKAGDEIASWFGDEDAARRREMDHRGRGPGNYTRSDERILEDACDSLTDDWAVDARNIQVTVKDGEVTLDGTVDSRGAKRRAEDCVHDISGVKHVQNNLRVQDRDRESWSRAEDTDVS